MKKLMILIILCFTFVVGKAQDTTSTSAKKVYYKVYQEPEKPVKQWDKNRLGVYASHMSGYGLAYQYHFDNGFALKSQFFAYGTMNSKEDYTNEFETDFGVDLQYEIIKRDITRFYTMFGTYYRYFENDFSPYTESLKPKDPIYDIDRHLTFGLGLGGEVRFWESFTFLAEVGYFVDLCRNQHYTEDFGQQYPYNNPVLRRSSESPKEFGIGGGVGLFFSF